MGLTLPVRGPELLYALSNAFFTSIPAELADHPCLAASEPDKRSYMYLEASRFTPLYRRPNHPTTVLRGRVRDAVELWTLSRPAFKERIAPAVAAWRARIETREVEAA